MAHLFFLNHSMYADQTHFDEAIYTQSAYDWATAIRDGQPDKILDPSLNDEHPALVKLGYAGAILIDWQLNGYQALSDAERDHPCQRPADCPVWVQQHPGGTCCGPGFVENATLQRYRNDGRAVSTAGGILMIGILGVVSVWAALLALLSTVLTQYTSLAFLEAPGALFSALAMVVFIRMNPGKRKVVVIGLALGLAAASKYYYPLVGLPIAVSWFAASHSSILRKLSVISAAASIAAVAFIAADPPLVTVGLQRALTELSAHGIQYMSDAGAVPSSPNLVHPHWYSALNGLAGGFDSWYLLDGRVQFVEPSPFLLPGDLLIAGLVLTALARWPLRLDALRIWLILSVAAIVLYPVKHNQYLMLAVVPFVMTAATIPEAVNRAFRLRRQARALPPVDKAPRTEHAGAPNPT